jgi:hypothetical protein
MATKNDNEVPGVVKDLADAVSKQSKYSNQLWLALVAASLPITFSKPDTSGDVMLPFSFGAIDEAIFAPVGFAILFILTMAFLVAYGQAHITSRFAQDFVRSTQSTQDVSARDFYDVLNVATFARVSSLAILMRKRCPKCE